MFNKVCKANKFGFCKFGNNCENKHIDILCEDSSCNTSECERRHPRPCKYFLFIKKCKFGEYCKYLHKEQIDKNVIDLENRIELLERKREDDCKKIDELEKKLDDLHELVKETNKDNNSTGKLDDVVFICEICGKIFKKKINMIKHRGTHNVPQTMPVPQLDGNDTIEDITTVYNSCQTELSQITLFSYKCESCDIGCKYVESITEHIKMKHSGNYGFIDYICEYCGSIFKDNNLYKTHLVQAHNVDPKQKYLTFKCKGCGVNHNLESLMKKHMEMSDEYWKFYDCDCGYGYELGSYLKNYLQKIVFHDI